MAVVGMGRTWAYHQIAIKELIPIVVTCSVWGYQWQNNEVLVIFGLARIKPERYELK